MMPTKAQLKAENDEMKMRLGEMPPSRDFLKQRGVAIVQDAEHEEYRWEGVSWRCDYAPHSPGGLKTWHVAKYPMSIEFEILRQDDDGEMVVYDYAPTLEHAKAACVESGRIEASDVLWIVERTPGREPNKIVRTWVPDDEEDGTGVWAVGNAYAEGRSTVWFDEQGNEHHHEE